MESKLQVAVLIFHQLRALQLVPPNLLLATAWDMGLGSAKIPLQLEGADSSWGCVVFVENFLKFSVINVYISQCWHPNFVIFPSESWEKHIKHFRLLMVSLYSEEVVRGSVYLSRTEKGLSRSHSTCQTEYIFTRNATYFQYLGCRMI